MELIEASKEFAPEIFAFLKKNHSENGFENGFEDWNYESFFAYGIASMINESLGIGLKPGHVAQTHCFLVEGKEVIGYFKIRHSLTPALRASAAGHIGYMIDRDHRGHGYAKVGLRLAIEKLKAMPDFDDEFILLGCRETNIASLKTQLACGGRLFKVENGENFVMFPLEEDEAAPILDFKPESNSFTTMDTRETHLPSKMIICFFADVIKSLLEEGSIEFLLTLHGETDVPIYHFKGTDVCLMPGIVGGPATGGYAEECIQQGVKKILFAGGAGTLLDNPVGALFVEEEAIRDEGYSYHYLPPLIKAKANRSVMKRIEKTLEEKGIPSKRCRSWTTDAFYRESKEIVALRKSQGAELVEMEQAGLIAMTTYRAVEYGALLYAGDDLSKDEYDKRLWNKRTDIRRGMVDLLLETMKNWD